TGEARHSGFGLVRAPECSAWLNTQLIELAAGARGMTSNVSPKGEGAGNAGRSMRPQPRMQNKKAYEHSHHGHTRFTRHSPRNGFNGFLRDLPGDRACLSPSQPKLPPLT